MLRPPLFLTIALGLLVITFVAACGQDSPSTEEATAEEGTAEMAPLAENAEVELVAGDFQFTEGPYWRSSEGDLLFSDIPANKVYRWAPGEDTTVFLEPSGHSNGITADNQGRILLAQHDGQVGRLTEAGEVEALVTEYEGQRLNSPNDLDVRSDGSIYFTDPPYGVSEEERELDFSGVYRLHPDGTLELLTREFDRPNGIVFGPDESRLYVNDSQENLIRVYDVAEDGSISNSRIFAEPQDTTAEGATDGMKVDTEGNLYTSGPGGIWIYSPEGELLDRLSVPEAPTNVAFGGSDMQTLYITARPNVYRVPVNIAGVK
jgi:gluconolactonase